MAGSFSSTVVVHGLSELNRDFGRLSRDVQRELQKELRHLAEPAADMIRREAAGEGFSGPTVSGIRAGSLRGGAVVRQRRRKTTGNRPDFGGIQFQNAFIPGADEAEPMIETGVEHWLGQITAEHGLPLGGMF